jgi:hypothetical protein
MGDLTIIMLTSNKVPDGWAKFHKEELLKAAGKYPIISISRKPIDLGTNYIDQEPMSFSNLYALILRGAKLATTPFIALVEDDTLYTPEHFNSFRPPTDSFGYNMNRWSLFTWGEAIYSRKDNKVGAAMIAPRLLTIEALEERFAKHPTLPPVNCGELGTGGEKELGVSERKSCRFNSKYPIVQFNHDFFSTIDNSEANVARRHKKKLGDVQAYDIPYWRTAEDLVKKFS